MPLKKMHNQYLSPLWDVSVTYQGSLVSFLVINPEQVGERKLVLRALILLTFLKDCPTYVPLWFLANHTELSIVIVIYYLGTLTMSLVGCSCKI